MSEPISTTQDLFDDWFRCRKSLIIEFYPNIRVAIRELNEEASAIAERMGRLSFTPDTSWEPDDE